MKTRKLGQLGTPVSAIGYGAMSFTDFYGPTDTSSSHAILARCLELGITHLDTSNAYGLGKSEKRIGSFLAKQGKQSDGMFQIATKVGITRNSGPVLIIRSTAESVGSSISELATPTINPTPMSSLGC